MFKIKIFKTVWDLDFWILKLLPIPNNLDYEKETSQKYQKVYQKRESSDPPGSFGY